MAWDLRRDDTPFGSHDEVRAKIHPAMNPHTLNVLARLGTSGFVSGESIASALGVTRATVWNAIRDAEALGVGVVKVRGQGYRLESAISWLAPSDIDAALGDAAPRFTIEVVRATASTNSDLMALAAEGAASGYVRVAELQTQGRGRRGRTWIAPLGSALTFSLLWRFEQGAAALSGLSLVVGLACARALADAGARGVGVKWPNDLQIDGRKLGGILIELQGDALGPSVAVIGIGINVRLPRAVIDALDQPAADLADVAGDVDRNVLLAGLLRELATWIDRFNAHGFAPLEAEFRRWHVLQGRPVTVSLASGERVDGVVDSVAPDGALVLATSGGIRRFHGGEVSVRGRQA